MAWSLMSLRTPLHLLVRGLWTWCVVKLASGGTGIILGTWWFLSFAPRHRTQSSTLVIILGRALKESGFFTSAISGKTGRPSMLWRFSIQLRMSQPESRPAQIPHISRGAGTNVFLTRFVHTTSHP